MTESILNGRKMLIVDDEPDILTIVEEEVLESCPSCVVDNAINFEDATELLQKNEYDIVVLDIMGVRGYDLLEIAVERKFNVVMLTAHALTPEALKKSHEMGARSYLPKDKIGELVPFLEDVLKNDHNTGWKHLMDKLDDYFNEHWGKYWKEKADVLLWY